MRANQIYQATYKKQPIYPRKEFLRYQRDFYATSSAVATKNKIKGYLINLQENRTRAQMLVKTLQSHRVDAYALKKSITVKGKRFNKYP